MLNHGGGRANFTDDDAVYDQLWRVFDIAGFHGNR